MFCQYLAGCLATWLLIASTHDKQCCPLTPSCFLPTDVLTCLALCAGRERATAPARGRAARRTFGPLTSGSTTRRWRWRTWRKLPAWPHPDTIRPFSPARTSPRWPTANQRATWAARAATQVRDEWIPPFIHLSTNRICLHVILLSYPFIKYIFALFINFYLSLGVTL